MVMGSELDSLCRCDDDSEDARFRGYCVATMVGMVWVAPVATGIFV